MFRKKKIYFARIVEKPEILKYILATLSKCRIFKFVPFSYRRISEGKRVEESEFLKIIISEKKEIIENRY